MKLKITALFAFVFLSALTAISQVQCAYTFTLGSGTYQALSSPTSINNGQVWTQSSVYTLPLDFSIPQASGRSTNTISIHSGSLEFGNGSPAYILAIYHWPFGGDMLTDRGFGTGTSLSPISYEISGAPGNRIAKIEFQNAGLDYDHQSFCTNPTGADYVNFQYWLYEASGRIEVRFGPSSVTNPYSYTCTNGSLGPFMKFVVDNSFLNLYNNANNPLTSCVANVGSTYGNSMNGTTAGSGTVYTFDLDPAYNNPSQVQCAYTYNLGSGAYQPLSNPIGINNGQVWTKSSAYSLPLGFNFPQANGRVTNTVIIRSGSLEFGNGTPDYLLTLFHWHMGDMLTDRGFGTGTSSSPISYEITGVVGSRIVKIQFQNAGFDYDYQSSCTNPTGADYVNFQYWLYESTGRVEVHFGPNSVMNPHSYDCSTNFGGTYSGSFVSFFVDTTYINLYSNATQPLVGYYNNYNYEQPMYATTAANGTVYIFNLNPAYAHAQTPCAYTFALNSGSYQSLSSPTSLNNGQVWTQSSSYNLALGFNFPLTSGRFTNSLSIKSGSIDFGHGSPYYFLAIFHWPFGGNMLTDRGYGTSTSLSPISYEISGAAGSRIVKIEFQNAGLDFDYESFCTSPTGADYVNFQYWLYEATGKIEVHFGPGSVLNPNSYSCNPSNYPGPFMKFIVDNSFLNLFDNASNPLTTCFDNTGIVYGNSMIGSTAANGTVYVFNPDLTYAVSLADMAKREQAAGIYPNPVKDILFIKGTKGDEAYQIINALGQIVQKGTVGQQVDVSSLFPGMYVIRTEGAIAEKFIKE